MIFRQCYDDISSTFTYLVADEFSDKAILVDPVNHKVEQYIQLLKELNLNLDATLETHLHADHYSGSGLLHQKTGCKMMIGEQSQISINCERFKDDDILTLGALNIKTLHTPGHTDDSYCFLLKDRVLTGDTLLIRGTGRTDFQNGSASLQYKNIHEKLFSLPDDTRVYPGHDYKGMTVSSIGEEKRFNPRLSHKNKQQYVELMNELNLPYPKMIDKALPFNKSLGLSLIKSQEK